MHPIRCRRFKQSSKAKATTVPRGRLSESAYRTRQINPQSLADVTFINTAASNRFATVPDQLPAITFWLLGSLASIRPQDVWTATPAVLASLVPLVFLRWRMNAMALGDEEATAFGTDPRRLRMVFILAATLMTAAVVSIAGVIGWVSIPHIARLAVAPTLIGCYPPRC